MIVAVAFAPLEAVGTILAPVVLVTSAAILAGGVLTMYGSVNDRMRSMVAERLELLGPDLEPPRVPRVMERLDEVDHQLPMLLGRHRMLRNAVVLFYAAIVVVVGSMFLVAVATTAKVAWVATAALYVLLAGAVVLAVGLVETLRAVRRSDDAIGAEVRRVLTLGREQP